MSSQGEYEVIKDGKVLGRLGMAKAFGELAILYNCKRTASIKALTPGEVWTLDRGVFQQIMMQTGMKKIEEKLNFLKSVPLFSKMSNDILLRLSDALEMVSRFLFKINVLSNVFISFPLCFIGVF